MMFIPQKFEEMFAEKAKVSSMNSDPKLCSIEATERGFKFGTFQDANGQAPDARHTAGSRPKRMPTVP